MIKRYKGCSHANEAVVDSMRLLQFLDMPEGCLYVRSNTIVRMEQHFFEATVHGHVLVLGHYGDFFANHPPCVLTGDSDR